MDRRSRYSKQVMEEALVSLLKKKDLNDISVSELCRVADVNRSTYYRYYSDPYSQLMELFSEYFQEAGSIINNLEEIEHRPPEDILEKLCEYHLKHREEFLVFSKSVDRETYEKTVTKYLGPGQEHIWDMKQMDKHVGNRSYTFRFLISGVDSVMLYWLSKDYETVSPRAIAEQIVALVFAGLKRPE